MENITTAEELIRSQFCEGEFEESMECLNTSIEPSITNAMIEFAKMHVQAALKAALYNAEIISCGNPYDPSDDSICVDDNSILNSYSLDNIK